MIKERKLITENLVGILKSLHWVKSVQIRSFFWSVFSRIWTEYVEKRSRKSGPEKTPHLDTFHVVLMGL